MQHLHTDEEETWCYKNKGESEQGFLKDVEAKVFANCFRVFWSICEKSMRD